MFPWWAPQTSHYFGTYQYREHGWLSLVRDRYMLILSSMCLVLWIHEPTLAQVSMFSYFFSFLQFNMFQWGSLTILKWYLFSKKDVVGGGRGSPNITLEKSFRQAIKKKETHFYSLVTSNFANLSDVELPSATSPCRYMS